MSEAHKRLEMVSEELKLMEYEAGTINRIIQGVVEMVAATMEEELCKMTSAEADVLKMLSTMAEAAEAPMTMDTREGALKMVSEAPNKLETTAGELNLIELEAGATEGGWGDLVIPYAMAEVTKENSKFRDKYKTTAKFPTSAALATAAAATSSAPASAINRLSYDSSSGIKKRKK